MSQEKNQNKELQQLKADIDDKGFAEDVVSQIEKDLVRSGYFDDGCMNIPNFTMETIIQKLSFLLEDFIKKRPQDFVTYLYLVDVPEKYLKNEMTIFQDVEQTATIILVREAQKVYLRRKFSP